MLQSPRTGSEVAPPNPSNHLWCRTCSHYSPSLFSGLRGGQAPIRPPVLPKSWQVLAFRQLVKCYRAAVLGVVLNTPQEDPHDSAAIRAALPQGEKLDRRPRPPTTEEPSKPADPVQNLWQDHEGGGDRRNSLFFSKRVSYTPENVSLERKKVSEKYFFT